MHRILQNFTVKNVLMFGFIIRIALLFTDFSYDVNNHILWGEEIVKRGFSGFYERPGHETFATLYPNYPPLIIYLFGLCYFLYEQIFSFIWFLNIKIPAFPSILVTVLESRNAVAGFMKLPAVIGDLALSYVLYLFTVKITKNKKRALWSMLAVLINPVFIYLSALWGQIDVLPVAFFFVVAVRFNIYAS